MCFAHTLNLIATSAIEQDLEAKKVIEKVKHIVTLDDEVWKTLVESNTLDATTQELLQLLFGSFSVTTH